MQQGEPQSAIYAGSWCQETDRNTSDSIPYPESEEFSTRLNARLKLERRRSLKLTVSLFLRGVESMWSDLFHCSRRYSLVNVHRIISLI